MIFNNKSIHTHNYFNLSNQNSWLLWLCQLVNIASLSAEISTWMLLMLVLCLGWQGFLNHHKIKVKYQPILLKIIAISGCIAIAITAKSNGVLLSMIHLLTFSYVLKAFELKQRKDFYQLSLLGFFLLASALIFKQNLVFSLLVLIVLILNLLVLLQLFTPKKSLFSSSRTVVLLIIQSAFMAVVLFIFFPRLSPFWQVPNAKSAQTGLTDVVSPGDIANLALSNELAFRVNFKTEDIPTYSTLYWRAMTLENYDGRQWTRAKNNEQSEISNHKFKPIISGNSIAYDVIVEPSYQNWLFGLSVAVSDDPNLRLMKDYTIQNITKLGQTRYYQVESYLESSLDLALSTLSRKRNLAIVKGSNPRLEALATSLIEKFSDPIARSNAVLSIFNGQQYFYTLQPPLLINNNLDQFFFDTKAGFCVHYASAYTYLMRAVGIPARIVTGYLGGEYNNVNESVNKNKTKQGGHLSIYQYDAHAWTEIWLDGIGWQRVDPTASVDAERVESGWSNILLNQQASLSNNLLGLHRIKNIAWLNQLRLQLDAFDYQWTRWVLGYSNKQQSTFLKNWFGDNVHWKVAVSIILTLTIIFLIFFFINRFNFNCFKRKNPPLHLRLYQQILRRLSKKGIVKPIDMTPSDFSKFIANKYPAISQEFIEFSHVFERLTYQSSPIKNKQEDIKTLKNQYCKILSYIDKVK